MKDYILNKVLSTFLILQILFVGFISKYPEWVERYYSNGVYLAISGFFRRLLGWIPFSVGDLLYAIFFFFVIKWIRLIIVTRMSPFRKYLYGAGSIVSLVFLFFNLFWGLNYYRLPLNEKLGVSDLSYTKEQLIKTTENHLTNLNFIHSLIDQNDSSVVVIPYKRSAIYKRAQLEYKTLHVDSLDMHFNVKSAKSSLFSLPMSYMGFSGYLNPFTGEAQVNRKIPLSGFPATTCHEMAHQVGFAAESEANYIGYIACMQSEDLYFQYSGELMAIRYLFNALAKEDYQLYKEKRTKLRYGIERDLQVSHDFWDSYHSPIEPATKKVYDSYLKANRQHEGIESYTAFVGYLVHFQNK